MPILKMGHLLLAEATQRTYETVRSRIFLCDRPSKFMPVSKTRVCETQGNPTPMTSFHGLMPSRKSCRKLYFLTHAPAHPCESNTTWTEVILVLCSIVIPAMAKSFT